MRLVDCFSEIFYYTLFLKRIDFGLLSFDEVNNQYKKLFDQAMKSNKQGEFSKEEWQDGLFAVCALIDETILCSEWDEKQKWLSAPLQYTYCKTFNAGEEFFEKINQLKDKDNGIRIVYYYCMKLGLKGRYYKDADSEKLEEIKSDTLKLITGREGSLFPERLFNYTYVNPAEKPKKSWLNFLVILLSITVPTVLFICLFIFYRESLLDIFNSYFKDL